MTGEKCAPDHIVEANKMVAAPAGMPGVEEIARVIAQADEQNGGPPYDQLLTMGKHAREPLFDQARAVIALFAPILAEKERLERENAELREADRIHLSATRGMESRLTARALAAEAALAAAVEALAPFADEKNGVMQDLLWGDQPDSATMTITCPLGQVRKARETVRAAAIRAQGE